MSRALYVASSHRWLHEKLHECAERLPNGLSVVERRQDADLIVYLDPPWPDSAAPDKLRRFGLRDLSRTLVYSQEDFPIPWAPGVYASHPRSRAGTAFAGGFYVAHHHREPGGLGDDLEAARDTEPDLLWSFVGTVENHPLRQQILSLSDTRARIQDTKRFSDTVRWTWASTHREEGRRAFTDYATTLARSRFVLCPRGRGAGTIRLFEALQVGRCPVIISDDWLPPPFVEWASCSLSVAERSVAEIPAILREREHEADELGKRARHVWEQFFSPERQLTTLARACVEVSDRVSPAARCLVAARALGDPFTVRRAVRSARRILAQREPRR